MINSTRQVKIELIAADGYVYQPEYRQTWSIEGVRAEYAPYVAMGWTVKVEWAW